MKNNRNKCTKHVHDLNLFNNLIPHDEKPFSMMKAFETNTRREHREGSHLGSEFRGRSTRQRHDTPKTTRGPPLIPRISKTLHAPAPRRAGNSERVATCAQNFEDAPRASVRKHRKQRQGRHLRPVFRRFSKTLHKPVLRHD